MTWLRVDDQISYAAATVQAGNAAMGAWLRMSAWSAAQLADGIVPTAVAHTMAASRELAALVNAGLVVEREDAYEIVGYLETNPSREQVQREREARRAGGRFGASRRWGSDGSTHGSTHDTSDSSTHGVTQRDVDTPVPARPVHDPERERAHAPLALPGSPDLEPTEKPKRQTEPRAARIPATDKGEAALQAFADAHGIDTKHAQWPRFVDYWRGEGGQRARKVDWAATWRNWLRRADETPRPNGYRAMNEPAPIPPPRMSREERERRERELHEAAQARADGWRPKMPEALSDLLNGVAAPKTGTDGGAV